MSSDKAHVLLVGQRVKRSHQINGACRLVKVGLARQPARRPVARQNHPARRRKIAAASWPVSRLECRQHVDAGATSLGEIDIP